MSDVKIKIKRSLIPGTIPGILSLGELAINIPDKKIYIGDDSTDGNTLIFNGVSGSGSSIDVYGKNGIFVDTDGGISLDLKSGSFSTQNISKSDKVPYLDFETNTTKFTNARLLFTQTFANSMSDGAFGTVGDQRIAFAIQDGNPDSFEIKTLQNGTGGKSAIIKIDTSPVDGSRMDLGSSTLTIAPSEELALQCLGGQMTVNTPTVQFQTNDLNFTSEDTTVYGINTLEAGPSGNISVDGNLIVSGYIETGTIGAQFSEQIRDLFAATLVAGDNIDIDYSDTNNSISISTLGSVWDRNDATLATDIFGIPAGTTIAAGTDAITVLERILYPFQPATISTFTMSGSTTVELGQSVSSPSFTWVIGNLTNANIATLAWSGVASGSSVFNPASNQTAYDPAIGTVSSTTAGATLSFSLTVTQDDVAYSNATSSRTVTWRPKIYVGRSTQSDYTNITNVTDITGGTDYFVSGTSPATSGGGVSISSGSGFIYILVHSSINDLSTLSIDQTPGQLSAFSKVSSSHSINNGYTNSTYKVYKSANQLTGSIRLDFT